MSEPRVSFATGTDLAAQVAEAVAVLQREGVVVLDDLTDPALLARCWGEIEAAYPDLSVVDRAKNYGPYEGRHTMPMVIENTLAEKAVLLPPPVAQIAITLLDPEFQVDSVGLLVAVPGAPEQKQHADAWLFPKTKLDRLLPPFALAFAQPLVPMDEVTGRTAFWRGSHRADRPEGPWDYAPVVNPGSAILWDYRIWHCGLANHSESPRPVIFTTLSREWWVEIEPPAAIDYIKLKLARHVHAAMKPKWRQRFRRALIVDPTPDGTLHAEN
jgi:Phytanoyl-CoA dioxygenase (PhyH)